MLKTFLVKTEIAAIMIAILALDHKINLILIMQPCELKNVYQ